ncbi:hypothetical protein M8J75_008788 [Diaphorina citri]|nr:hypothetical protein M8J75_008788 [Diaphorina citri]
MSTLWSTVSNALERSMNEMAVISPSSIAEYANSQTSTTASFHWQLRVRFRLPSSSLCKRREMLRAHY